MLNLNYTKIIEYDNNATAKGAKIKIGKNHKLAGFLGVIAELIKEGDQRSEIGYWEMDLVEDKKEPFLLVLTER